jgi:hypothetical protein
MGAQITAAPPNSTPAGKACSISPHTLSIGTPPSTTTLGVPVIDGQSAEVTCSVSGTGTFSFDATVEYGNVSLSISDGSITDGGTGSASIELTDTEGALSSANCSVVVGEDDLEVAPGRIWARFECPGMGNDSQPSLWCASEGIFILENCNK